MSAFKRGITNQEFISELNKNKFWLQMVKDEDLFIAIRNEYLNVYYYGQSICKVTFVKKQIKWMTHKKYLGIDGSGYTDTGVYLDKIEELKKIAKKHGGREKEQVKKNILEDKKRAILDVEITFGKEDGSGKRSIDYLEIEKESNGKRSIDLLAIEKDRSGKIKLVFYEAKLFDNPEIKSINDPKVYNQIEKYEIVLNDINHKAEILNSYRLVYENIKALNLNNKSNLVQLIGEDIDKLEIDDKPRLMIFAIDKSIDDNKHIKKLMEKFGGERLKIMPII